MHKPDLQLLLEYAEHGSEAAFREIVVRHTDLVYSSALRQVTSPDLAHDVAQSVFVDLARKAKSLARTLDQNASILGWLYRSTRFAALNQLRDERRRQAHERQFMDHFDPAFATATEWNGVRPVLCRAFAALRHAGENQFIISMQSALGQYVKASNGQFPSDLSQLKPYFESAPDDALLQRYAIVPAETVSNIGVGKDWIITVKNPVDEEYDTQWALGVNGFGSTTYESRNGAATLAPALKAYAEANNGQEPKDSADLLPYLTTPEQHALLQKLEDKRDSAK
ncbi:MAG: sigma factor [Verrucomicrobiota bacterium]